MIARGRQPVGDDLGELVRRHAGMRHRHELHQSLLAGRGQRLHVAVQHRLERLLGLPVRICGASALTRSRTKASWTYIGCSIHSVPSLSKVAMRWSAGTKSGPPCVVTRATKSVIDRFGRAVVPGRQRIAWACADAVWTQRSDENGASPRPRAGRGG